MTAAAQAPQRRLRRTIRDRIGIALLVGALLALMHLAFRIAIAFAVGALVISTAGIGPVLLAVGLYLGSHLFRVLRLALLIGDWRVSLRAIGCFHFFASAVGLAFPLKLGEIYRLVELSYLLGNVVRAIMIVWWERAFDIAAILALLAVGLAIGDPSLHAGTRAIAALAAAFVVCTLLIFFVAPDNLRRLSVFVIRRYDSPYSIPLLWAIGIARDAIREAPRLVRDRIASLVTLTGLIWTLEAGCVMILVPALGGSVGIASEGLLAFLSEITQGETLLGMLGGDKSVLGASALRYFSATQVPLAIIGLGAGVVYAALRQGRRRE